MPRRGSSTQHGLLPPLRHRTRRRGLHAGDFPHSQVQGRVAPWRIPYQVRNPRHLRCHAAGHGDGHVIPHAPRPTARKRLDTAGNHVESGDGETECRHEGSHRGTPLGEFSTACCHIGDTAETVLCQGGLKARSWHRQQEDKHQHRRAGFSISEASAAVSNEANPKGYHQG